MKAIELKDYGGADALELADRPDPVAGPGQVVVRMVATSFNPVDPKRASGLMKEVFPIRFPYVPGGDVSGLIEAVGEGVTDLRQGDEVYGYLMEGGAYAERVAVAADKLAAKPANLSFQEAAALVLVGQSAMQALEAAGVRAGGTLVVIGAGGAIGSIVVQLASRRGVKVVAVASPDDADRLRGHGAARVVDRDGTFENGIEPADAVIDTAGGEVQQRAFALLKPNGILVALSQPPSQEEAKRRGVRAVMFATQTSRQSLDALRERIEAGEIVPFVGRRYPLAEVAQAWRDAAARTSKGKSIIEIA